MGTKARPTVEQVIVKMLTENTGIALCGSGGENGRMWQHNQGKKLKDFEKEPAVTYDAWGGPRISLYHFLKRDLDLDRYCYTFNSQFVRAKDWDAKEFYGVSTAGEEWITAQGFKVDYTFNSYNGESMLSQIIQGTWLTLEDKKYLLLQIHGGADARGGYTDARLFRVHGYEDGAFREDVYGCVTKKDGTIIEVDNQYNGYSLTTENGEEVKIEEGDKVELYLRDA